jgi:hypothetical protein
VTSEDAVQRPIVTMADCIRAFVTSEDAPRAAHERG